MITLSCNYFLWIDQSASNLNPFFSFIHSSFRLEIALKCSSYKCVPCTLPYLAQCKRLFFAFMPAINLWNALQSKSPRCLVGSAGLYFFLLSLCPGVAIICLMFFHLSVIKCCFCFCIFVVAAASVGICISLFEVSVCVYLFYCLYLYFIVWARIQFISIVNVNKLKWRRRRPHSKREQVWDRLHNVIWDWHFLTRAYFELICHF